MRSIMRAVGAGIATLLVVSGLAVATVAPAGATTAKIGVLGVSTPPVISGTGEVGDPLTLTLPVWNLGGVANAIEWRNNGNPIDGATGAAYTPVVSDAGDTIVAAVTGSLLGQTSITTLSNEVVVAVPLLEATAAPVITGTTHVGSLLTASAPTWNFPDVTTAYQWFNNANPIGGATGTTYTPVLADAGDSIRVRATGTLSGLAPAISFSDQVGIAVPVLEATAAPIVTGTPAVGSLLTTSAPTWNLPGVTTTYEWLNNGDAISGATGTTYTPVLADGGDSIRVRATGTLSEVAPVSVLSDALTVPVPVLEATVAPIVTGTPAVGSLLTVSAPTWNQPGVTTSYQWLNNGDAISGATGTTYTPVLADAGDNVRVRATGTLAGFTQGTVLSNQVAVPVPVLEATVAPVLTGTPAVGSLLTVSAPTWSQPGVTTGYQWLNNGDAISGATGTSYTPVLADAGDTLRVRATGTLAGLAPADVLSNEATVPVPVLEATVAPVVSGTPAVGSLLTVSAPTWNLPGVTTSYEWLNNGSPIGGATGTTYTPVASDAGDNIRVRATGTLSGVTPVSVLSNILAIPEPVALQVVSSPQITGTPAVGSLLSVSAPTWNQPGVGTSYQWLSNGDPISGATGTTYTPVLADAGDNLRVRATGTLIGVSPVNVLSNIVTIADPLQLQAVAPPEITGIPEVGSLLTASAPTWNQPGVTTTYQWLNGGSPIGGATDNSYLPTLADAGDELQVAATGTLAGVPPLTVLSDVVTIPDSPETVLAVVTPPSLMGTPEVGEVLSVVDPEWNLGGVTQAYQWLRDGEPIGAATTDFLVLTTDDAGHAVSALVTGQVAGQPLVTTATGVLGVTLPGQDALAAVTPPAITGDPKVGEELTAVGVTWNPADGVTTSYQWLRDGASINGATEDTYTLGVQDLGTAISVLATGQKGGFANGYALSAPTTPTIGDAIAPTTPPSVSGGSRVGKVLTADPGDWGGGTTLFTYQWTRDGVPIPGKVGQVYQLRFADAGRVVAVTVTGTREGYLPGSASAPGVPVKKIPTSTHAKLAKKAVAQGKRGILLVRVTSTAKPEGKIRIYDGKKVVRKLDAGKRLKVRLPKLKPGKHGLKAVYVGTTATQQSVSKKVTLKVLHQPH